jgi:hypothetical protein
MSLLIECTTLRTRDHPYPLMPTKPTPRWKGLSDRSIRTKPPSLQIDSIQGALVAQTNLLHYHPNRLEVGLDFDPPLPYSQCHQRLNVKLPRRNRNSISIEDPLLRHQEIISLQGHLGRMFLMIMKANWRTRWQS